jgi:hypothetical protein
MGSGGQGNSSINAHPISGGRIKAQNFENTQ